MARDDEQGMTAQLTTDFIRVVLLDQGGVPEYHPWIEEAEVDKG